LLHLFKYATNIKATIFRYSLSVLKIYSIRYVHYRFSVLAVNQNAAKDDAIMQIMILRNNM